MKNPLRTRLRIRFVTLSMAALLLLQGIIVSVSIYHNYNDMVTKSDAILSQLHHTPAANIRYFSVKVHPGKGVVRPDVVQHVSVTPEQAAKYAKAALDSGKERGFVGDYRFHLTENADGMRILFLSRASSIEMLHTAAANLVWVSVLCLCVVFVLLIISSGWVVKPLVDNHHKQKQFITAASHELKTPLTIISTDAQLLQADIGDNEWIDGILQQVDHLTRMTHDLVLLAKAEEYENTVVRERFSLSEALREVAESYMGLAVQKGICLTCSIPPAFLYKGCEKELRQLMQVLLDNAFKYCPASGEIRIRLKREFRGFRLTVCNTSAPISKSDIPSLTQRFCRGQNAAGTEGFGLGLSIAKTIANRHNGNLTANQHKDALFLVEVTLHE